MASRLAIVDLERNNSNKQQHHHHQPAMYNINKNDFREVVKLASLEDQASPLVHLANRHALQINVNVNTNVIGVHIVVESPISAYIRFVHNDSSRVLGLANSNPQPA
ncbi:hypothetical protein ACFE04_021234 [Oxalis oulophora]